jgi:hypothetical protein
MPLLGRKSYVITIVVITYIIPWKTPLSKVLRGSTRFQASYRVGMDIGASE